MGKYCFKCGETKPLGDFYKHSGMGDGYLGKCKECTKLDVRENRRENSEYYKKFDRGRANLPHRVAARKAYALTSEGKAAQRTGSKAWDRRNPIRKRATTAVGNAVRDGRLVKLPCDNCGAKKVQGHHTDYSKPLEVIWLCPPCHSAEHKRLRAS